MTIAGLIKNSIKITPETSFNDGNGTTESYKEIKPGSELYQRIYNFDGKVLSFVVNEEQRIIPYNRKYRLILESVGFLRDETLFVPPVLVNGFGYPLGEREKWEKLISNSKVRYNN